MLLLHINTALPDASICISEGEELIEEVHNHQIKDHASWLQPAIQSLVQQNNRSLKDLKAISVASGPGSYTGLRVGLSAAKGLCYALDVPLILINTLDMINVAYQPEDREALNCPMIDARRMEVFTAIYDRKSAFVLPPTALILEKDSFGEILDSHHINFFGDGSAKFQSISTHPNAFFPLVTPTSKHLIPLSFKAFTSNMFADLAYSEPFYGKEFFSPQPKPSVINREPLT